MAHGAVAEFSYAAAVRLFRIAGHYWPEIDGACARQGFDPLDLGVDRFLNLVYAWCTERMANASEEDWTTWKEVLYAPLTGLDPDRVTQDVIDDEMSLFYRINGQNMG